jgi:hypothetical protein
MPLAKGWNFTDFKRAKLIVLRVTFDRHKNEPPLVRALSPGLWPPSPHKREREFLEFDDFGPTG